MRGGNSSDRGGPHACCHIHVSEKKGEYIMRGDRIISYVSL